jgi:Cu(I)/Ag(I) efflux system periplasmic protein CusF
MIPMSVPLIVVATSVASLLVTGCNKSPNESPSAASTTSAQAKRYDARGVIKGFTEGKKAVNIAHEEIPNFMKAMTMPFDLASPSAVEGLTEGDAVDFTFTDDNGRLLIQTIKKRSP